MTPFVGKPAPNFEGQALVDGLFQDVKLDDYKGKWLIFFFYPMDFTFVCPTELRAFSSNLPVFQSLNVSLLSCSTDTVHSHLAWARLPSTEGGLGPETDPKTGKVKEGAEEMKVPMLSDRKGEISKAWGVLDEDTGNAVRGSFLVDPKGLVRQITINEGDVGRSVTEMIRLVKAYQFTDANGGMGCPANWDAESNPSTIKTDFHGSKEYFKGVKDAVAGDVEMVSAGTKRPAETNGTMAEGATKKPKVN